MESVSSEGASDATASGAPRSVEVAFRVLEAISEMQPVGVSSIARALDLPKSTVQRALRALEALQYVYPSGESTRWSLTLRAFQLGARAKVMDLRVVALPEMTYLSQVTQESIQLTVWEANGLVIIEKIDSRHAVRSHVDRGQLLALHCSATGKAFLAAAAPEVVDEVLASGLDRRTPTTIIDPDLMRAELEKIRQEGYAFNDAENRPDVRAVGTVVRDSTGAAVAGISVSVPKHRLAIEDVPKLAAEVVGAADRISSRLGWNAPALPHT